MRFVILGVVTTLILGFVRDAAGESTCEVPCVEDKDCPAKCDDDGNCLG